MIEHDYPINYPEMIVPKADGVTAAEKKLISLGYKTFFSLWSYPNPYRKHKLDKELCDLLVVFGDDIIIFSDKDCKFPLDGDVKINWGRWYKNAIVKSYRQLQGAMSWMTKHPDRIVLDSKGEVDFPLSIQVTENTRFHLVSVAHGIKDACIKYFSGGDGGLIIDNCTTADSPLSEEGEPFRVGVIDKDPKKFIHIFDDASYALVLKELDTTQDFIDYLEDRKHFLLSEKFIQATSEQEMLAAHLDVAIHGQKGGLAQLLTKPFTGILLDEGSWDEFVESTSYKDWKNAIKISYFWDNLLSKTIEFIEKGQSTFVTQPTLDSQSKLFYQMAKETRWRRKMLSEGFLSFFLKMPNDHRGTRIILNERTPEICYVLLLLPRFPDSSDKEYRSMRAQMLIDYCSIAKADHPELLHIIGIAHESNDFQDCSEDFLYFDATGWTEEDQKNALDMKQEFIKNNLLGETTMMRFNSRIQEFSVKGKDRNKPCPCGSGLKYKKCHGRIK